MECKTDDIIFTLETDHAGLECFSTGKIIAIAVPTSIIIIALATIICIVRYWFVFKCFFHELVNVFEIL